MKKKLNLLLFNDIKVFLGCENLEYIIKDNGDTFQINNCPIIFNDSLSKLKSSLAYDYDNLCEMHQNLYKDYYKSFNLINDNIYKLDVKIYNPKKKSFK